MKRIDNSDPLVRSLSRLDLFRLRHDCELLGIDHLKKKKREIVRDLALRYRDNLASSEERSNCKCSFDV